MAQIKEVEWNIPDTESELSGKTVKSKYWDFPIECLPDWRPYTACLDYRFFEGPKIERRQHGFQLNQDLVAAVHGPRGATKTMTMTYLLSKKMRMGQPAWANYPISFYVIEPDCIEQCQKVLLNPKQCGPHCPDGVLTYYENMPLDLEKFYHFSKQLRNGNVAITEFQYYVESRTSGKKQNRLATYQIMQIRKTALSFFYDVQNPEWVDKRFAWSDDTVLDVQDISKMRYDYSSVGHFLEPGERSQWHIEDRSGVLSGKPHSNYGPFEFNGWPWRNAYPTHFIVDAYEAMNSLHEEAHEQAGREDKKAKELTTLNIGVTAFAEAGEYKFTANALSKKVLELTGIRYDPTKVGKLLHENGLQSVKGVYNISSLIQGGEDSLGEKP